MPTSEAAQSEAQRPFRGLLGALLRFRTFEALRHREYRLIWYGQIFASMGTWMDQVTRGWLIYELTDSALQLGLVRGVQAIPFLLLSPVAGSVADRYSRKMQVVLTQTADGILYAAMALLIFTGLVRPWHAYVTAVLMAVVQTFLPARAALISDAVPPNNLTNAIGLNAVVFNAARSTGPALAGVLIAKFGTGGAYSVQALFLHGDDLDHAASFRPALRRRLRGHSAHEESFGQSIIEGWKFSWRNEVVRTALLIVMFVSLFIGPFTTLLPVFARDILQVGATGQGLLLTAMGVGAVCSAVLIASAGDRLPRGMLMLVSVMLYGFFTVMFAASPWFWLSMVLMVIGHVSCALSRPCANGHPILFAYRVPRPDHGYLPHEPGRADDRRHALRSAVILCRGAVGGGVNGRRRRADHDRDRPGSAGRGLSDNDQAERKPAWISRFRIRANTL